MTTKYRKTVFSSIPSFGTNAVIQLIIACGVSYVIFHLFRVTMLVIGFTPDVFERIIQTNLAIPNKSLILKKFWTVFTYGWLHMSFWQLVTDMIWLYTFGSLVQMLVGRKQVIPLFIYGIITGGVFYTLAQFIPGRTFWGIEYFVGPQAGIMALAAAAVTITPKYRFFLTPTFSIPMLVVVGLFVVLMVMTVAGVPALLFLLLGGALIGFLYVKLLQSGYKPGEWAYDIYAKMEKAVTPDEQTLHARKNKKRQEILNKLHEQRHSKQRHIDDILDKINQKGYNSLTDEEKEILIRASKEDN